MIRAIQEPTSLTSQRQTDYLTIGQASRQFNLHPNTLRFYCQQGLIEHTFTLGGHRRLNRLSLEKKLGLVNENTTKGNRKVAIYVRVSSQQQKSEGGLKRQEEKLIRWVEEKYNQTPLIFTDVASSFGRRKGLESAVFAMIDGKVSHIIYNDVSRLSRVPSTSSLLEAMADRYGVQLVPVEEEEDQGEINLLVSELANYCQILCARMNARKGAKVLAFDIPAEGKEIILKEYARQTSIAKIRSMLHQRGIVNPRNGKRIGHGKISDYIVSTLPDRLEQKTSGISVVERFLQESFVILNKNASTTTAVLYDRFKGWCVEEEVAPLGKIHFCMELQRSGLEKFRGKHRSWRGIGLDEA